MRKDKIHLWESLRGDALGEDTAMRVLYSVVCAPFRWFVRRRPKRPASDNSC